MTKFLDKAGLSYFWGKIKNLVQSSVSGLAVDSDVVHKTGDEDINGKKTFKGITTIEASLQMPTSQGEGVYVEAGSESSGKMMSFFSIEDDSEVRLNNIANPVYPSDAVNKNTLYSVVNNTEKCSFLLFSQYQQGTHTIGSTGIDIQNLPFSGNELNMGQYKVTLLRHIWYDGTNISSDSDINVQVYFQKYGSQYKTFISGGTYIMHMITSPNDARNRMGSVVVNLVGFITLTSDIVANDNIVVQVVGSEGMVLGGEQPIAGVGMENVDDNDFVLFEKLNITGLI